MLKMFFMALMIGWADAAVTKGVDYVIKNPPQKQLTAEGRTYYPRMRDD